jgi:NhaP-type Na+/H+ and K+/H+ antiporter
MHPFNLVLLAVGLLVFTSLLAGLISTRLGLPFLLEGGISTRMQTFRAGFKPALVLAAVGVALTAGVVGAVAMLVMKVDWHYGLLLGAIVGSTDAAAVFSLLRQVGFGPARGCPRASTRSRAGLSVLEGEPSRTRAPCGKALSLDMQAKTCI